MRGTRARIGFPDGEVNQNMRIKRLDDVRSTNRIAGINKMKLAAT